jgi:RNA polymerase sigma-70 factor (ECF subfamily)
MDSEEISLESPEAPSDEELLQGIRERRLEALETLYERYKRQGLGLAYRITSSREAAEEVLQDSFLAVWQRGQTYTSSAGRVRPWLFSIIHHRSIDFVRRRASRPAGTLDDALFVPGGQDVFSDAYANISGDQVKEAMRSLPAEQSQALELFYFGGLTFNEMAEALDVPVGTLKSRVRLALARMRTALEQVVEP